MAPGSWPGSPRLLALPRPQHPAATPILNLGDLGLLLGTFGKWSGLDWGSRNLGESIPWVLMKEKGPGSSSGGQGTPTHLPTGSQGTSQPESTWAWQSAVPASVCDHPRHRARRYLSDFSDMTPGPPSARSLQSLLCSRIQERPLVAERALDRFSFSFSSSFPFNEPHFLNFCVSP